MLTVIEKVIFLQNVDIFSEVPSEQLAYLAAISEEVACEKGEVIYREEEPIDALYIVLDGKVELRRKDTVITEAAANEALGTLALFDEKLRVVTALAMEDTRLLYIDREEFFDLLADRVEITQGILKTMVSRMRNLVNRVGLGTAPAGGEA